MTLSSNEALKSRRVPESESEWQFFVESVQSVLSLLNVRALLLEYGKNILSEKSEEAIRRVAELAPEIIAIVEALNTREEDADLRITAAKADLAEMEIRMLNGEPVDLAALEEKRAEVKRQCR